MTQSKVEWRMEEVFKVINLYRQFPCLWDIQSSSYKRNDLKRNGWKEIAKHMQKDEDEVRKKIKNLRTAYVAEKRKVECGKKSGSGTDEVYYPHLFYYDELQFLNASIMFRKTASNLDKVESETPILSFGQDDCTMQDISNFVDIIVDTEQSQESVSLSSVEAARTSKKTLKRQREDKFNTAIDAFVRQADMSTTLMSSSTEEEDTVYTVYGKSIGMQLSQLSQSSAAEAMSEIQAIVSKKMLKDRQHGIVEKGLFSNM